MLKVQIKHLIICHCSINSIIKWPFTFRSLTQIFPDFSTLKSVLAGLNLPHNDMVEQKMVSRESQDDDMSLIELQRPSSPPLPAAQLLPFQRRIRKTAPLEGKCLRLQKKWGGANVVMEKLEVTVLISVDYQWPLWEHKKGNSRVIIVSYCTIYKWSNFYKGMLKVAFFSL